LRAKKARNGILSENALQHEKYHIALSRDNSAGRTGIYQRNERTGLEKQRRHRLGGLDLDGGGWRIVKKAKHGGINNTIAMAKSLSAISK